MDERGINWGQIIVTALITGVVAIATGMILFKLQTRQPNLTYESSTTSPFHGTEQDFAVYNVSISNNGAVPVDDVVGLIEVKNSLFEDYRIIHEPSLQIDEEISLGSITIRIPELNPNETIDISVLATSKDDLPNKPDVSVRGSGVIAKETGNNEQASLFSEDRFTFLLTVIVAAYSGVASLFIMRRNSLYIKIFGKTISVTDKHSGNQNRIMAYLCGVNGLHEDVQDYLTRPNDTAYWAEADMHAAIAEANPDSPETEARKKVLIDLLSYAKIADLSRQIIKYDIARIAAAQGNQEEAKEYISKIKSNPIITSRLKMQKNLDEIKSDRNI
jgi:hypothetical protein